MLLNTPGEAHMFEMGNDFRNAHTPRLITFQAPFKELLSKLAGVLWLIFEEHQQLQFTLIMMLTDLSCTSGEIGKWLAVSWQDGLCRQVSNFFQGGQVVAERVRSVIFRVESY